MEQAGPLETWATLFPTLHSRRDTWLNSLDFLRTEFPGEDVSEAAQPISDMLDRWLWLENVAERMSSKPELLCFRPLLSMTTIRLIYDRGEVHVDAVASDQFKAQNVVHQGNGHYDVTPVGEGDAEQTADCIAAFLHPFLNEGGQVGNTD